jgi:short-subunit dehydrogenase
MMKDLENKVIVIAGAAGGIGSATAQHLARHGAQVILAVRTNQASDQLLAVVRAISPGSEAYVGDLRLKHTWLGLVEFVHQKFARLDGLVNCVGLLNPGDPLDLTSDEIESEIRTNIESLVFGAQAVLPLMRQQRGGAIVTIGSLGGIVPMPFSSLYCATKHAVRGFSLSMNEEYRGRGISFCLLSLGPVKTKMLDREAEAGQSLIAFVNKPLHPDRVALAVLSLLRRPRPELILPRATGVLCLLSGLSPGFFAFCYHTLRRVGEIRLHTYRQKLQNTQTIAQWENEREYIY